MAEGRAGGLGRGGRVLLYLSLAVNLLVVGLVVGALVSGGEKLRDRRPPSAGEAGFGPVFAALEPEDRRASRAGRAALCSGSGASGGRAR
ncbi:MAG: hypothetical protein AAFZ02_11155, partial [Pseudomonadota bacterium]